MTDADNSTGIQSDEVCIYDHEGDKIDADNPLPVNVKVSVLSAVLATILATLIAVGATSILILNAVNGKVSADNSSSTPLAADTGGADHIFTGEALQILDDGIVFVSVSTDAASAADGLLIQQSSDGTNWDHTDEYTVPANGNKNYAINPFAEWLRVMYTNGVVEQTHFRLQTIVKSNSLPTSHRIQDPIVDEDDARLVKSVLSGQSDITGTFENVSTYREAMQVDAALVHRVGISEHAKRDLGGNTTLDVAASSGDTLINVTATTDFIVGDLVKLYDTSIIERSHFHITAVSAGVSLTLDRPLDNDFEIGDNVQEVQIGMNVDGTLGSPISYKVQPPSNERWQITRIMITLLDQTAMDDAKFGGISALSNGVVIRTSENGVIRTYTHWKSNADLKDDMYDVTYSNKAPAGFFGLSARWTFTKAEFAADLNGATGDYLEVLIQDSLSALDDFEIKAQGRLFGQ